MPAWRTGTTTLFDVPARQTTKAGVIDSLERFLAPLTFTNSGSEERCRIVGAGGVAGHPSPPPYFSADPVDISSKDDITVIISSSRFP